MRRDEVLDAIKVVQDYFEDEKECMNDGVYLRMCNALGATYKYVAEANEKDNSEDEGEDEANDEEEDGEESDEDEEPRERTEDDMELNELSELWECQFDFGRWNAVRPLEDLIETIVEDFEEKRVCAAVRVLNRAVKGSKPDDPEDAERILRWKEELVEQQAIKECAEILEGNREFQNSDDDPWMYSVLCDEILELFQRLGEGDALYRTKLRRGGALKGLKKYQGGSHLREAVLDMLQQR